MADKRNEVSEGATTARTSTSSKWYASAKNSSDTATIRAPMATLESSTGKIEGDRLA